MYWRRLGPAFLALGLCASAAPLAHGQTDSRAEVARMTEDQYGVLLRSVEYRSLREIVEQNLVYGENGEEIGEVTDLVFAPEGQILSVIAKIDGIWETQVSIPWKEVVPNTPADGIAGILVPVDEEDEFIPELVLTPEDAANEMREVGEEVAVTGGAWLATGLLGAPARIEGKDGPEAFGLIQDAFMEEGEVFVLVIRPEPLSQMPELVAVPFPDEAVDWSPRRSLVDLGYSFETLLEAPKAEF
ncbi:hypothetical protein NTH_00933 [Nitratireductor thuwali]|uniref:PRC-barrel domain-containing protein n=2 Tax=Nitratireductor thuwali TaxID=2267699 RepID=A0ABY5MGZ3_9HYPH|nr:hypothetical protein NTH_00933 [Nitratireductor thuwali]